LLYQTFTALLFLFGGIYCLLVTYKRVNLHPDINKSKDMLAKWGTAYKWGGWVLTIWGSLRLMAVLFATFS